MLHTRNRVDWLIFGWTAALLALSAAAVCQPAADKKIPGFEGGWETVVTNGQASIKILMHIVKKGDEYSGDFLVPDRSVDVYPLTSISVKDTQLQFNFAILAIKWAGKLNDAGTQLTGIGSDGVESHPMNFTKSKEGPTRRPQEPTPPLPYTVQAVQFVNGPARITLGGTVTLPTSKPPYPGVVLMSGAGQTDRDGSAYGHHPYLVIADYLTRRGIAVLRIDDRGVGKSEGDAVASTLADYAQDIATGVGYLKARGDIGKIGVIGTGSGGAAAVLAAQLSPDVAFVELLATPALDGRRVLTAQADAMAQASGAGIEERKMLLRFQSKAFSIMANIKKPEDASGALVSSMTDEIKGLPSGQRAGWLSTLSSMMHRYNMPWVRFFASFDPTSAIRSLHVPVLALYGANDTEISAPDNSAAIDSALKLSQTKDFKILTFPGLNHLLQTAGPFADYESVPETIAPSVLKEMGDWVDRAVGGK